MRRQKTARPPRHPAEHEYHSGTLSNEPEGEGGGGGGWPFFLRDIGTTRAKIHGGCRDRTRVVGSATRAGRPRQETKKTGSQETAGAPTDGSWIALACTAARFALSVSGTGASRIPCAQLKPRRRCNKNGGRRPRGWGETAPVSLSLSDLIQWRMLEAGVSHRGTRGAVRIGERRGADVRCPRGRCRWANKANDGYVAG
jgi:hypothetical protein